MAWPIKKLGEILDYEQPTKYLVSLTDYKDVYPIPVLTAGKSFILGNTNEKDGVFPKEKLPVIIFDDFTTAIKFVDFPFKVKSSAMKILHAKKNEADIKYLFNKLLTIKFPHNQHKRYWISECSKLEIPLPPLAIQQRIVERLDKIAEAQKLNDELIQKADELYRSLLHNELNTKFKMQNSKLQFKIQKLGDIAEVTSSKRIYQSEYIEDGIPFYRTKEIVELSQNNPISLELFISENRFNEIKEKFGVPKKGDVLISAVGTIGISWVVSDDRKFYFKDGNLLWIKNLKDIDPIYLKIVLETFANNISKLGAGAAYNALTIIKLKRVQIPVPPLEIQKQIVEKLSAVQEYKKKLLRQKELLQELFGSTLDKTMKGELVL